MQEPHRDRPPHHTATTRSFVYLACVVLCNSSAQLCLKAAALHAASRASEGLFVFLNIWYLSALGSLGMGFLFWQRVLAALPLAFANPFGALVYVIVPMMSCILYGDKVNLQYVLGCCLLFVGVCITAYGAEKKQLSLRNGSI